MKVIYLRVSKEELDENTQLPEILKVFDLKSSEYIVLQERVSAYSDLKQKDRFEFIKLKQLVEQGNVKQIYVYSSERLERNIIRMFEFFFFCEANGCKIYSATEPILNMEFEESPFGTYLRYNQVLIYGLLGQSESYRTSLRTKKSVRTQKGLTFSKDNHKWGSKFKGTEKNPKNNEKGKVELGITDILALNRRISFLIKDYEQKGTKCYYNLIINDIKTRFQLNISKGYISKIKNGETR